MQEKVKAPDFSEAYGQATHRIRTDDLLITNQQVWRSSPQGGLHEALEESRASCSLASNFLHDQSVISAYVAA